MHSHYRPLILKRSRGTIRIKPSESLPLYQQKVKKMRKDLNRLVTTDRSKFEWDA